VQILKKKGAMHTTSKSVAAAIVLSLSGFGAALAQQPGEPPAEIADQVELCVSCHGEDGRPVVENVPILFGQELYYMFVQLRDYAAGRRENEIMAPIAAELDRKQMEALAKYFSEQTWPTIQFAASDQDKAAGQTVGTAGQCPQCHLGGYNGNSRVPRLAGQKPDYLAKTMLDFKNRVRKNAPDKSSLLSDFSEEDLKAMANYLAGL
jgi:cytochrome c553